MKGMARFSHRGWSALSLVPRPLSHHPSSFVCLHCSSCSVLSFLLRKQFSKHFLSIFCLLRSVLGPGGTGMVKILTQLLRGRKEDLNAKAASLGGREALEYLGCSFLPVGPWANYRTSVSLNCKPRSGSDDRFLFKGSGVNSTLLTDSSSPGGEA